MTMTSISALGVSLKDWMIHSKDALAELCAAAGVKGIEQLSTSYEVPEGFVGAFIPMVGLDPVRVGLFTNRLGAVALTRGLRRSAASDGEPSSEEVDDALGELANILAGNAKRRLGAKASSLQLGLPVLVRTVSEYSGGMRMGLEFRLGGGIVVAVIVMRPTPSA